MLKNYKDLLNFIIIKRPDESLKKISPIRDLEVFMKKTMPTQRNCLIFDLFKEGSIKMC